MTLAERLGRLGIYAAAAGAVALAVILLTLYSLAQERAAGKRSERRQSESGSAQGVPGPPGVNILLVVVDALRPDFLGCYGGEARTPKIDALAREGVIFERCFANAPWTSPSMASLLTSHHPSLCTEGEEFQFLARDVPTVAEVFRGAGYRTGAVVSSPWLKKEFGFGRGFEDYIYVRGRHKEKAPGSAVTEAALRRVEKWRGERFFLLVHYIDPHMPYGPAGARDRSQRERQLRRLGSPDSPLDASTLTEAEREYVRALYRSAVEEVDGQVGRLLSDIEELRIEGKTTLVLTADHGEEFWEHGKVGHGHSYYDEALHVPLLMRLPWLQGARRVGAQVRLLDLMPTLLEVAGATAPPGMEGRSLLPLMHGAGGEEPALYAEGSRAGRSSRCVRTKGLKVIYDPATGQGEVYDLLADPQEKQNLIGAPPAGADKVLADLKAWARLMESIRAATRRAHRQAPLPATTLEELRSLGYINPEG